MKQKILLTLFLLCLQIEAYSRKFLKIENCTTSGIHAIIEECMLKDNKFNLVFRYVNGTSVANVSSIT